MRWDVRFRLRQYLKGSLWFLPLVGAALGSVLSLIVHAIDGEVTLPRSLQYSASAASSLLTTIVGAMVAFTGFVVTISVLVIQLATGTFSARYMRLYYRDRMQKAVLAVLIGTLSFSFASLRQTGDGTVPSLGVIVAGFLVLVSLVLFLFFLDRFIHRLRPVAVAQLVAQAGMTSLAAQDASGLEADHEPAPSEPVMATIRSSRPGAIQAIDEAGLLAWAIGHDAHVHLRHTVGDFLPADVPLIDVHAARRPSATEGLERSVAMGIERTIEQDVAFAVRIMVDVAIRALSPAVNDPTTAVQVIDHLDFVLRTIGARDLTGSLCLRDAHGQVRVTLPARRWEEYLTLTLTEIRQYGGNAIQVMRRLRAMLTDLRTVVRPEHVKAVEEEIRRLDATVRHSFGSSVDLDRALIADQQGIGGPGARTVEPLKSPGGTNVAGCAT